MEIARDVIIDISTKIQKTNHKAFAKAKEKLQLTKEALQKTINELVEVAKFGPMNGPKNTKI